VFTEHLEHPEYLPLMFSETNPRKLNLSKQKWTFTNSRF